MGLEDQRDGAMRRHGATALSAALCWEEHGDPCADTTWKCSRSQLTGKFLFDIISEQVMSRR